MFDRVQLPLRQSRSVEIAQVYGPVRPEPVSTAPYDRPCRRCADPSPCASIRWPPSFRLALRQQLEPANAASPSLLKGSRDVRCTAKRPGRFIDGTSHKPPRFANALKSKVQHFLEQVPHDNESIPRHLDRK